MFHLTYVVDIGQQHTKVVATAHLVWVMLDDWTFAGQFVLVRAVWDGFALEGDKWLASFAQQLNRTEFVSTESEALALASGDHLLAILQHQFTTGRNGQEAIARALFLQQQGEVLCCVAQSELAVGAVVNVMLVMTVMGVMFVMAMFTVIAMLSVMTMVFAVVTMVTVMTMFTVMAVMTVMIVIMIAASQSQANQAC